MFCWAGFLFVFFKGCMETADGWLEYGEVRKERFFVAMTSAPVRGHQGACSVSREIWWHHHPGARWWQRSSRADGTCFMVAMSEHKQLVSKLASVPEPERRGAPPWSQAVEGGGQDAGRSGCSQKNGPVESSGGDKQPGTAAGEDSRHLTAPKILSPCL